jgi:outer membrane murein-binding lipoprotein Lpp
VECRLVVLDLSVQALDRLNFWVASLGFGGNIAPEGGLSLTQSPALSTISVPSLLALAGVVMNYFLNTKPDQLARRSDQIKAQAKGRFRAKPDAAPATSRMDAALMNIQIHKDAQPYAAHFTV